MREITNLMEHYRVTARSVWNTAFWSVPGLQNWDSWDRFEQIKKLLFDALVKAQLEEAERFNGSDTKPDQLCRVVPIEPGPVPIMIHRPREGDRNRYWDDPIREVKPSQAELCFLDYFDWNSMSYLDFQYYRVRITAFPSQPHLVGREALVDHQHATVFVLSPSRQLAGSAVQK